jgi:hypothetical protein
MLLAKKKFQRKAQDIRTPPAWLFFSCEDDKVDEFVDVTAITALSPYKPSFSLLDPGTTKFTEAEKIWLATSNEWRQTWSRLPITWCSNGMLR